MAIENFGSKINSNGFDKNPENINKEGRPVSIKSDLKRILEGNGQITIKAESVSKIHENGDITIHLVKSETLAMKLLEWAMSRSGTDSIKAIKMIMEQIEGKSNQKTEHLIKLEPITGMTIE